MSGINFRTSNFQVNTKLQRATVNNQKNEQEETKAAEKETQKPQVKLNIQTSGLNALGRYNMVSVNTTAKRATLKPASTNLKPTSANLKPASNSADGKVNNEREKKWNSLTELKLYGKAGDYYVSYDKEFDCYYLCQLDNKGNLPETLYPMTKDEVDKKEQEINGQN